MKYKGIITIVYNDETQDLEVSMDFTPPLNQEDNNIVAYIAYEAMKRINELTK